MLENINSLREIIPRGGICTEQTDITETKQKNNLTFERKLSPAITPAVGFVEVMPPTARAPLCVKNCTDR